MSFKLKKKIMYDFFLKYSGSTFVFENEKKLNIETKMKIRKRETFNGGTPGRISSHC